jgi:hypothetical protein
MTPLRRPSAAPLPQSAAKLRFAECPGRPNPNPNLPRQMGRQMPKSGEILNIPRYFPNFMQLKPIAMFSKIVKPHSLSLLSLALLLLFTVSAIISGCSSNKNKEATIVFDEHADSLQLGSPDSFIYLDSLASTLGDRMFLSLKERDGIFFLLDQQSNKLFAIDSDGKTRYVIDKVGRGHGEYLNIIDFEVSDKGLVYLLTGEGKDVMTYDKGEFSRKYELGFNASSMSFLNDTEMALFRQRYPDEQLGQDVIIITDTAFNVKNHFLEESSSLLTGSGEHLVPGPKNTALCYQMYINNLYWFDANGIVSELKVDFGEKVFPESLLGAEDFEKMLAILQEISAYYINSCYENGKYLLLNINLIDHMDENMKYILLYDKKSGKSFIKKVDAESNEYAAEGIPMNMTEDNKVAFLYDLSAARQEGSSAEASSYAIAFRKIKN